MLVFVPVLSYSVLSLHNFVCLGFGSDSVPYEVYAADKTLKSGIFLTNLNFGDNSSVCLLSVDHELYLLSKLQSFTDSKVPYSLSFVSMQLFDSIVG